MQARGICRKLRPFICKLFCCFQSSTGWMGKKSLLLLLLLLFFMLMLMLMFSIVNTYPARGDRTILVFVPVLAATILDCRCSFWLNVDHIAPPNTTVRLTVYITTLGRFSNLDCSTTKRVPTPNDRSRRDVSNADLFGTFTIFQQWSISSMEIGLERCNIHHQPSYIRYPLWPTYIPGSHVTMPASVYRYFANRVPGMLECFRVR